VSGEEEFVRMLQRLRVELEKLCRELQTLNESLGKQIKLAKEGENGE